MRYFIYESLNEHYFSPIIGGRVDKLINMDENFSFIPIKIKLHRDFFIFYLTISKNLGIYRNNSV